MNEAELSVGKRLPEPPAHMYKDLEAGYGVASLVRGSRWGAVIMASTVAPAPRLQVTRMITVRLRLIRRRCRTVRFWVSYFIVGYFHRVV